MHRRFSNIWIRRFLAATRNSEMRQAPSEILQIILKKDEFSPNYTKIAIYITTKQKGKRDYRLAVTLETQMNAKSPSYSKTF